MVVFPASVSNLIVLLFPIYVMLFLVIEKNLCKDKRGKHWKNKTRKYMKIYRGKIDLDKPKKELGYVKLD